MLKQAIKELDNYYDDVDGVGGDDGDDHIHESLIH